MSLTLNILIELSLHKLGLYHLVLGATTMGAHHSFGWSTGEITLIFNILSVSCLVSSYSGIGTFLGTVSAKGFASSFSLMVYSSFMVPSP